MKSSGQVNLMLRYRDVNNFKLCWTKTIDGFGWNWQGLSTRPRCLTYIQALSKIGHPRSVQGNFRIINEYNEYNQWRNHWNAPYNDNTGVSSSTRYASLKNLWNQNQTDTDRVGSKISKTKHTKIFWKIPIKYRLEIRWLATPECYLTFLDSLS